MKDLRATPLDPAAAGVSLHAEALETILTGNFLNRPDFAHGLEVVASFLLGLYSFGYCQNGDQFGALCLL